VEFKLGPESLDEVPLGRIVQRMLTNLKGVYLTDGDFPRAARIIERLRQLDPDDPLQSRDLGAALVRAGVPGRAMDALSAYLEAMPDAEDVDSVRQLLRQAMTAVAKWN
jgi:regulator of sirC expression with transglutaminase-like and TPR domain